jgi:hypothetical protein
MAYSLTGTKSHVKNAANYFGPKHGITTIYGVGPGSVANSDHPSGLALDFMTKNKSQGDALAADVISQAGTWNVKYVIWYRRIWQNGQWKSYSGPSSHTDHVHVSFNASATGTPVPDVNNPLIPDSVETLMTLFKQFDTAFEWLTRKENWARVVMFVAGLVFAFIGLIRLDKTGTAAKAVGKGATYVKS